ncbi:protein translocase subunit SecD [Candidatus Daviesbacteria bacterium]|nr:protein translocase subunit SecD [Candidatus Daviesbacteria bacterium]
MQLILQTDMSKIDSNNKDDALQAAREVIERRVNLFGVSEAIVQTSKVGDDRRIIVELPGIKDATGAADLVGKTAQLEFRELPATISAEMSEATKSGIPLIYFSTPAGLTGADLEKAQVTYGSVSGGSSGPQVAIEFTSEGANKFAEITKRNIGKSLPIFLDEQIVSAPTVNQEILGGSAVITGQFTTDEAKKLAVQLNAGALPVPIKILEQRVIGPTLGQEAVNKSLVAGIIGLAIVMVYMGLYYGLYGILADIALLIYTAIVLAIFKTGLFVLPPVTLTLAGIAGFILSIGMAVDANILIFERIKEEIRWGKSKSFALRLGFDRAWSSIWASNVSSLITAAILYYFGTSLIKGFAITLAIGVLVSMFTAIVVTRTLLRLVMRNT